MKSILTFLFFFIASASYSQHIEIGSNIQPANLQIKHATDSAAIIWDNGDARLMGAQDAFIWNRAKLRFLLDADNDNGVTSQFSLFSDVLVGDNENASVNFDLNGGKSWINSGNFGINTNNPTSDLEIMGASNSAAIEWDSGGIFLRHHYDMLVSKRGWMRFLIDADNDDDNAHFALYNNKTTSSGVPAVRFHLDGGNSYIGPGNFGIGTNVPGEKLQVAGAIKMGNTTNPNPLGGTMRWTGQDFQGRKGGQWISLTGSMVLTDNDGDTKVEVEDGNDPDKISFFLDNTLSSRMSKNTAGQTIMSFPNNNDNIVLGSTGVNSLQSGSNNIFMGASVGLSLQNSHENILIGKQNAALSTNTDSCVYIGNNIGVANTTGQNNVAIGHKATLNGTDFQRSVVIGSYAGENLNRSDAVIIGHEAGFRNITFDTANAFRSVMIGSKSGWRSQGAQNIFIGYRAGEKLEGINNVAIGHETENTFWTKDNNIFIGSKSEANGSNNVALGFEAVAGSIGTGNATAIGVMADAGESGIAIGYLSDAGFNDAVIGNTGISDIGGFSGWSNLSDGRVKHNVTETVLGLEFLNRLRPVNYNVNYDLAAEMIGEEEDLSEIHKNSTAHQSYQDSRREKGHIRQSGFIAQEVEQLVTQLNMDFNGVSKPDSENGLYALRYSEFIPHIVQAIQEQQEMIQRNETIISDQAEEINQLKFQMDEMLLRMEKIEKGEE